MDMIELALHTTPDTDKVSRVVGEHTWDRKVGEMVEILLKYLNEIHWAKVYLLL